ncbi:hypothetical protein [Allomesorhizobium camelthorni]|uniref:Uncharacterized protein n=1 Tax=Allomesorhizobium camelthorni TaxID=475069 RepID=A0A6G4WJZ9_9HYPH|nr:hypothetical protein [Mesorhizobium camelthorni]NGO54513.1 hypothetical protein [Mesorhizobium camelthorni]
MTEKPTFGQRDYMRKLVATMGRDQEAVCMAYAKAERDGLVPRMSNTSRKTPDEYAVALWKDGTGKRGWLNANRT